MNLRDFDYTIERGVTRLSNDKDFREWAANWMLSSRKLWKDIPLIAQRLGTTINMVTLTLRYLYGVRVYKHGGYAHVCPSTTGTTR